MYLAVNTVATARPLSQLSRSHPFQPHLILFVGIAFDEKGRELDRLCSLVRPVSSSPLLPKLDNWRQDLLLRAKSEGTEPQKIFHWFTVNAADAKQIYGHDVLFHIRVMQVLGARLTGEVWEPASPLFCSMHGGRPG